MFDRGNARADGTTDDSASGPAGNVASSGVEVLFERLRLGEAHRDVIRAASGLDLEELAAQVAAAGLTAFGAESSYIRLAPFEGVPGASAAVPQHDPGLHAVVEEFVAGLEVAGGPARTSSDGAVLCVTVGMPVIGTWAMRRDKPWTQREQDAIAGLGDDLGSAVRSARMHHRDRSACRRLRALDESTRQTIATVAHEMKNPLTSLIGHLELLATDEVESAHIAPMQRSAGRLLGLVDSFLDLVRSEAGDPPVMVNTVNLTRLVRAEVDSADLLAQCAGVHLRAVLPVAPVFVTGPAADLERLVTNLLGNALKFTPDGGTVTVHCQRKGDQAVLRVTDTGIGISATDQRRLFERYFRSTNPDALAIEGTGLGLSIVAEVVARHGGDIECRSVLGEGTTFEVRLPSAGPETVLFGQADDLAH